MSGGALAQNQSVAPAMVKASYQNAVEDSKQFIFDRTPRVAGLPQTAPRYDEITKPSSVPVPAACISNETKCNCYTQQATPMNVPDLLCRDIVARGYFVDFDDKAGQTKTASSPGVSSAGAVVLSSRPQRGNSGPSVATIGDEDGYGVLGKRGGSLPRSTVGR